MALYFLSDDVWAYLKGEAREKDMQFYKWADEMSWVWIRGHLEFNREGTKGEQWNRLFNKDEGFRTKHRINLTAGTTERLYRWALNEGVPHLRVGSKDALVGTVLELIGRGLWHE